MSQKERRTAFAADVKSLTSASKVYEQYGVSNSAHISRSAVRVGVPNLVNYKEADGPLVVVSELTPEPGLEIHLGVEVGTGNGVEAWLDKMASTPESGFSSTNNNVAVFLRSDGLVYLHNRGKDGTDGGTIDEILGNAGSGFPCGNVFVAPYLGAGSSQQPTVSGILRWLERWVGTGKIRRTSPFSGASSGKATLADTVEAFGAALELSGLWFGDRHLEEARAFLVSLATRRLGVLTGLSGSGKTQIGVRFGEWLGDERLCIVPVRPDWTGPEYLLGYEDVLREPSSDGRGAWQVPEALEFMLRAAADEANGYVLLLDEMNLAHVERYFADVLSGMESGAPCLPNLRLEDGVWRRKPSGPARIPWPRNLFVVGTVNVDETTYMFSPKVLDRANTFEFRVRTDQLNPLARRPSACAPGEAALVANVMAIAQDDDWHLDHPHPQQEAVVASLRAAHAVLTGGGFEFGHRVFFEAIRFASILAEAGNDRWEDAVDLQILQKVLPRLHGSRRQVEPTLCRLAEFCVSEDPAPDFDPLAEGYEARFPMAFAKLRRMVERVRANQFVSFAE